MKKAIENSEIFSQDPVITSDIMQQISLDLVDKKKAEQTVNKLWATEKIH